MGIQDFDAIFDLLDFSRQGYLQEEQIKQFYEMLHFSAINKQHVEATVKQICGANKVHKKYFVQVSVCVYMCVHVCVCVCVSVSVCVHLCVWSRLFSSNTLGGGGDFC